MLDYKGYRPLALATAAAVLAGCSVFQWSGHHKGQDAAPENIDPRLRSGLEPAPPPSEKAPFSAPASTGAAKSPARDLSKVGSVADEGTWYYTDLGPDAVDVSGYPAQQKYNYAVYARVCSSCHTLARSINLPVVSRGFWEYYLLSMRGRNWLKKNPPITKDERKAIIDFLEYDSQVRKVLHKKEFEALDDELERRFAPIFEQRLRRLQQADRPDNYLP